MTSPRGQRRREHLLGLVAHHLAQEGLVEFSLRRAAQAAGTTHKVLLYHFGSGDDLLREALGRLRDQRLQAAAAATTEGVPTRLGDQVQRIWEALLSESAGPRVLDQASGLALYDPVRYLALGQDATEQYLPVIHNLLPRNWTERQGQAVAALILAVLRGLLVDALTAPDAGRADGALAVLARLLNHEEQEPDQGTGEAL